MDNPPQGDEGASNESGAAHSRPTLREPLDHSRTILRARAGSSVVGIGKEDDAEQHLDKLRDLHGSIVSNIDHVQEQTARILQEQERDLLRAFRARLYDLQMELEKEKARAEDGATVWIEKNRMLAKELDWAKEMADRLDRHNQGLVQENARLKNQYRTQEEDREYLIKQLVVSKKDNARLRTDLNALKEEVQALQAELEEQKIRAAMEAAQATAAAAGGGGAPSTASADGSSGGTGGRPKTSDLAAAGGLPAAFFRNKQDEAAAAQAEAFAQQVEAEEQQMQMQQQQQMQQQRRFSAGSSRISSANNNNQSQQLAAPPSQQQQQQPGDAASASAAASPDPALLERHAAEISKYREAVLRLKKVLDNERRANRALRMQLTHELGQRTEAEMFLRRSIEHAKREVDRKRQALMLATVGKGPGFKRLANEGTISPRLGAAMPAAPAGTTATSAVNNPNNSGRRGSKDDSATGGSGSDDGNGIIAAGAGPQPVDMTLVDAYSALPQDDRDQILASLLAQEHVLNALQRITFPQRSGMTPVMGGTPMVQSLPNSRRGSSTVQHQQHPHHPHYQQHQHQQGSGGDTGEGEYLEVEGAPDGDDGEGGSGGGGGGGAGEPEGSLGSLPPAASVNFHDQGSHAGSAAGGEGGGEGGGAEGGGGGFVPGFAAADSISLQSRPQLAMDGEGEGEGMGPGSGHHQHHHHHHHHPGQPQAPMPVLSNSVPGGNGLTPRDVLQAAKEYTKEVQETARGRVEAIYGKDFDAALSRRANAHYSTSPGKMTGGGGGGGGGNNAHSHSPTSHHHNHNQPALTAQQIQQQQIEMGAFAGPEHIQGRKAPVMHNPPVSPIPLKTFSKPTIGKAKVAGLKTPSERIGVAGAAASPNPQHGSAVGPSGSIGGHGSDGGGGTASEWESSSAGEHHRPASFREAFTALQDKFPTVSQAVNKKFPSSVGGAASASSSSSSSSSTPLGVSGGGSSSGGVSKLSSLGKAAQASLAGK